MNKRAVISLFVVQSLMFFPPRVHGQQAAPVAKAFRDNARDIGQLFILAADAMPADRYSFRAPRAQYRFVELLRLVVGRSEYFCTNIRGLATPDRSNVSDTAPKALVVTRVREAFQLCDQMLLDLDDANLGAPYMGSSSLTRANAMMQTTLLWADLYGQLATDLRLNGRVPPIPCNGDIGMTSGCSTGYRICRSSSAAPGQGYLPPGSTATLSGLPYSITSDGLGPYIAVERNGYLRINASQVASLEFASLGSDGSPARSIKVDLNHPVPGDIGVPLGVVASNHNLELASQWYTDSSNIAHSIRDIPIGTTVTSEQTDVGVHINGVYHVLQMGPQRYGHCFSDGSATYGDGTTRATIHRVTATEWVVDLPPGSVGRLFDIHLSAPNAVNKGLYYVSVRYVIKQVN